MKSYTYHAEIMTMIEQFTAAFNDIIVKGYDKSGNLISNSDKSVRFIYAPKQRVFDTLNTPGPGGITTPVVSVSLGGISRDKSRVFNKNQGFSIPYNTPDFPDRLIKNIPQPVPVNITVNMSIMTRYQEHMDQIISNFVPYCDPYIIISWRFPGLKDSSTQHEIRSEVLWDGNIKTSYPTELQANQSFRLTADTSFVIKGWLFKRMEEVVKKIYYIDSDFMPVSKTSVLETLSVETVSLSATPKIKSVYPYNITFWSGTAVDLQHTDHINQFEIDLYGKYFFEIKNVYLSASNPYMLSGVQLYDPFANFSKLSADHPPFFAVKLSSFEVLTDQNLKLYFPQIPGGSGYVDVIAENECGYGKLTVGSRRPPISSWSGWTLEQPPYVDGILINTAFFATNPYKSGELVSNVGEQIIDNFTNQIIWT